MTRRTSHRNPARVRLRGRGPSPKVEALLRDFTEASFPNPLGATDRNERVLKGIDALVRLEPDGSKVFVAELRALRHRQGIGTQAMQFLTDLADKHGVKLALFPHPFGVDKMPLAALVDFYRRFGFQHEDEGGDAEDEMVRWPREINPPRRRNTPRRRNPPRRRNGIARAIHATPPTPAVAAFMAEWKKRDMDTVFADMGVRVDVLVYGGDEIELELIEAENPRKGAGSLALRTLLDLVDKHHLGVTLNAMPFSRWLAPTIPLDDLVRFYQRFGFRVEEEVDEDEEPESYVMYRSRRNPSLGSVVLKGPESGAPRAVVYVDGKEVGYAQLTRIQGLNDPDNPVWECEHEIRTLRQRVGPSTLWVMWRAYLDDEHQNKGYGVAMYEALLRGMHAQYNKPAIIFPEECVDGGRTSNAAMRVWASLGRRWESEGRAVASIPLTPNPRR